MRVVHLSTTDIRGGAARAAYRLHIGLRSLDVDSVMLVSKKYSQDQDVTEFRPDNDLLSRVRRRMRRRQLNREPLRFSGELQSRYEYFSKDRCENGVDVIAKIPTANVVNLHWVAGFFDYKVLLFLSRSKAGVVWTLHDMNSFTGGCHYDNFCGKFTAQCGNCPQLGEESQGDLSSTIWQRKRKVLQKVKPEQLHIVTPSRWLSEEVKRSALLSRFALSVIPYGLDTETFRPKDKKQAREKLGLPTDAKIILFLTDNLTNNRKGGKLLVEVLAGLKDVENLLLVTLGEGGEKQDYGIPKIHLGQSESDKELSLVYSAADIFAIPSIQDNLPNVILESLACGTPVVGFATGGLPDMVRSGITGFLVELYDTNGFQNAARKLLLDEALRMSMSNECRRIAVEEYSLGKQARRYSFIYDVIAKNKNSAQ